MLKQGKVSIVVPIYKVEKYIHRCINSILQQSYEQLEVILVNDGSPDRCGKIADGYKKIDKRVKVIHKDNGGLSDARNCGMQHVTGEFTMFVDSDDWLDQKTIEMMVTHQAEYQADIVQTNFYYVYDHQLYIDNRYYKTNDSPTLLTNKELMHELIVNKTVKNFAWGKLYKTKLILDIPFKKGVLFEDVFWAHQIMQRAENLLILHEPLFYYFQHGESIVAKYNTRSLDIIKGLKQRHSFIEEFYEELVTESYKQLLKTCLIHYNLLVMNRKVDKDGKHRKEMKAYISSHYEQFKEAAKEDKHLIKQLKLFIIHPYINILYLGLRKGLRSMKILSQPQGLEQVNE